MAAPGKSHLKGRSEPCVGLVPQAVKSATMDLHGSMQEGLQKQEGVLKSQLLDVQLGAQRFEIESFSSGEELAESNEKHRTSWCFIEFSFNFR